MLFLQMHNFIHSLHFLVDGVSIVVINGYRSNNIGIDIYLIVDIVEQLAVFHITVAILRREECAHKTRLTTSHVIEVHVRSQESEQSCF
jgi:hypothetical protein